MKLLDYDMHKLSAIQVELEVLVLASSERVTAALHQELSGNEQIHHSVSRTTSNRPLQDEVAGPLVDVVILELATISDTSLDDIRRFVDRRGGETELFVTLPSPDTQAVKALLQAGVADILGQPFDREEIRRALAGTRNRQQQANSRSGPSRNAVSAFMQTHPSAGGNFSPLNIAWQLATQFRRNTVLVDMDIQFGTMASELDMKPDSGLLEALRNPERIDKVFLDALVTRHPGGLNVLASPGDLSPSEYLNRKAIARLISVLAENYEHVVINLPLFVNDAVEQVFRQASPLFLVTQSGMSALRNLKMILDRLAGLDVPAANVEIIHLTGLVPDDAAKAGLLTKLAGDSVIHRIHQDHKLLMQADNEGKAASELYPRTALVRDLSSIAANIAGQGAEHVKPKTRSMLHWFK